jgi:hypothetical protein
MSLEDNVPNLAGDRTQSSNGSRTMERHIWTILWVGELPLPSPAR